jgi:Kef-type K+ transport system membrane component KefB
MPALSASGILFLQIAVVLVACRAVSVVIARVHQPPVLGQLIAGVLLGPSLLGLLLPQVQHVVFPASSLAPLNGLGQIGVVIYMFIVGAELDFEFVRRNARSGVAVALTGVLVPVLAGGLLGSRLVGDARFFPDSNHAWVGVLFMGVATGVTAFPVMARIIADQGLQGTPLANLCLVCGSFTDIAGWCLLAVAIAGLNGDALAAVVTIGGGLAFSAAVFAAGWLVRRRSLESEQRAPSGASLSLLLTGLMVAATVTEAIGIHPAFGAFLLGAALGRLRATATAVSWLRPMVTELLLPLYFAYAGLHTSIALIGSADLVLLTLLVIVVACVGKGGACFLAALLTNRHPRDAAAVGVLMNARGVVELIILTVGLERRIVTPTLFAIMVTMTIVTTLMPAPILRLLYREGPLREEVALTGS